jgi:UDP-N-acetylglucosamine--N-acetylmuramyl-(pentapeptide) pyrophosphoryl-undecaprenol N-acetylglucosamine transferase
VLFAGGGTGGHIYPNVAIVERLAALRPDLAVHFMVSDRPGDAKTLGKLGHPFTPSPVQPLPPMSRPWRAVPFVLAWRRALAATRTVIAEHDIACVGSRVGEQPIRSKYASRSRVTASG